jgi:hypothetical protein
MLKLCIYYICEAGKIISAEYTYFRSALFAILHTYLTGVQFHLL